MRFGSIPTPYDTEQCPATSLMPVSQVEASPSGRVPLLVRALSSIPWTSASLSLCLSICLSISPPAPAHPLALPGLSYPQAPRCRPGPGTRSTTSSGPTPRRVRISPAYGQKKKSKKIPPIPASLIKLVSHTFVGSFTSSRAPCAVLHFVTVFF